MQIYQITPVPLLNRDCATLVPGYVVVDPAAPLRVTGRPGVHHALVLAVPAVLAIGGFLWWFGAQVAVSI